jgi:hypothetical protein
MFKQFSTVVLTLYRIVQSEFPLDVGSKHVVGEAGSKAVSAYWSNPSFFDAPLP